MKRLFKYFTVITSVAIFAPQVCALEAEFIRNNLARTYEGTFQWHGPDLTLDFLPVWFISIPVITLIALFIKKKSLTIRNFLTLSVLYNFAALVLLLHYLITMSQEEYMRVYMGLSLVYGLALIVGTNSVIIGKKVWRDYIH